jgi:fumarate reductase subunit C
VRRHFLSPPKHHSLYQSAVKPYVTAEGQVIFMLLFCIALCLSVSQFCQQHTKSHGVKQQHALCELTFDGGM